MSTRRDCSGDPRLRPIVSTSSRDFSQTPRVRKHPSPQVLVHRARTRVSQIYETRAKVSEILRRVTAAASVTTFFLASVTTFLVASCGPNSSQPTYDAAIQEGQTAVQELINQGASAVAIALVDDKRIIWSQGFGLADRDCEIGRAHV